MTSPIRRSADSAELTIPASAQASDSLETDRVAWGAYQIPSAFTGSTVTVEWSNDGTNWSTVTTSSGESNPQTVSTNGTYALPVLTAAARYFRLKSGSSEAAARTIKLHLKS